jgi:hypothetical protein
VLVMYSVIHHGVNSDRKTAIFRLKEVGSKWHRRLSAIGHNIYFRIVKKNMQVIIRNKKKQCI